MAALDLWRGRVRFSISSVEAGRGELWDASLDMKVAGGWVSERVFRAVLSSSGLPIVGGVIWVGLGGWSL